MIDPKAEIYIPGWVNTLQRESVSSDGSVLKGTIAIKEMLVNLVNWN